jgi:hypothetical protein
VSVLDRALRAHADGGLCAEAAAGLLIAGRWLERDGFASRFVTVAASPGSGTQMAPAGWPAAAGALGAGLPCPGGERRLLQVTASLAAGIPAGLRDAAAGLDGRNARLVADAVLHACGHRGRR